MRRHLNYSTDILFVYIFGSSHAGFQVSIKEVMLKVTHVTLTNSQQLAVEKVISTTGALYPLSHVSMKRSRCLARTHLSTWILCIARRCQK